MGQHVDGAGWRKSSYSGPNGGSCVELGQSPSGVLVRDTTNRDGVVLTVPATSWRAFTTTLK